MMVCVGWYERMQRKIWHIPRAILDKKICYFLNLNLICLPYDCLMSMDF